MLMPNESYQQRRISVTEVEADYFANLSTLLAATPKQLGRKRKDRKWDAIRATSMQKPLGFQNKQWEALKTRMRPGDELWKFCSPKTAWDNLEGIAGYKLIRNGIEIAIVVSRMN